MRGVIFLHVGDLDLKFKPMPPFHNYFHSISKQDIRKGKIGVDQAYPA